jgi:hypothetical protein
MVFCSNKLFLLSWPLRSEVRHIKRCAATDGSQFDAGVHIGREYIEGTRPAVVLHLRHEPSDFSHVCCKSVNL